MSKANLLAQLSDLGDRAAAEADSVTGGLGSIKALILDYFGPNGLTAAYIVAAVLALVLVWRLVKIGFDALKYVVIPSVALAAVGSFVLGSPFVSLLPVTVVGCSLIMLFKG
ncbi:MAG: hypothetical protein OEV49_15885 [candidate division Zixibacteria bacterium]|nr:hypothetical protein [candidate division Zixibacteria bacterium]MDH3937446.1 hypothetical protein [candidate division Zixibacteria bacterium]MDH4034776.1 hypothetical protein [candidate division Zixibacteria bacterium]